MMAELRPFEEMRARGNWVTPLLEGRPWLEKPPLYYWVTIPIYGAFGVCETTARVAPALFALATALWMAVAGEETVERGIRVPLELVQFPS